MRRNPNPPPHPPLTLCVEQSAAGWRLDKRSYFGGYPSDQLALPPVCSPASLTWETLLFNEAAQGIRGWPRRDAKPAPRSDADAPLRVLQRTAPPQPHPEGLTALLVGSGPWQWGRLGEATSGLFLLARGVAFVGSKEPKYA